MQHGCKLEFKPGCSSAARWLCGRAQHQRKLTPSIAGSGLSRQNPVRTHLRNINAELDVHSRIQ
jgi:hypothetical protein